MRHCLEIFLCATWVTYCKATIWRVHVKKRWSASAWCWNICVRKWSWAVSRTLSFYFVLSCLRAVVTSAGSLCVNLDLALFGCCRTLSKIPAVSFLFNTKVQKLILDSFLNLFSLILTGWLLSGFFLSTSSSAQLRWSAGVFSGKQGFLHFQDL